MESWLCALKDPNFTWGQRSDRKPWISLRRVTSYRAAGSEREWKPGKATYNRTESEIEESLAEDSGRIKRTWKDGRTNPNKYGGWRATV